MGDITQQDSDSLLHYISTFQCSKPLFLFNPVSSLLQSTSSTLPFPNFTAVHTQATASSSIEFQEQVEYTRQPPALNNSRPLTKVLS